MGRDRAAYMREYRARQRVDQIEVMAGEMCQNDTTYMARIVELEAEVARLKRELAGRPAAGPSFNSRPFSPAPKPGR